MTKIEDCRADIAEKANMTEREVHFTMSVAHWIFQESRLGLRSLSPQEAKCLHDALVGYTNNQMTEGKWMAMTAVLEKHGPLKHSPMYRPDGGSNVH